MSEEKRKELVESGALWPSGERKVVCPTCGTLLPEGQQLLSAEGDAVATPDTVVVGTGGAE